MEKIGRDSRHLQVIYPDLENLKTIIKEALPPKIPLNEKPRSILISALDNIYLKKLEKSSALQASIAQNYLNRMKTVSEYITHVLTLSLKNETEVALIKHNIEMVLAGKRAQEINEEKLIEELRSMQLDNRQKQADVEITELDLELRRKEAREYGLAEAEDNE